MRTAIHAAAATAIAALLAAPAAADEQLLQEAINLQGIALYFSSGVPALVSSQM